MELKNPRSLAQARSPAPALSRGLALLLRLGSRAPLPLENLAEDLGLPKASAYRLLCTLEAGGLVRKRPDKYYEPLWKLQPLEDPSFLFRQDVEKKMGSLCKKTGCTVEWYEPSQEGMRLVAQSHPDRELRVQAQPGFLRSWNGEFEAVARLGHAFAPQAPSLRAPSLYVADGVLKKLPAKKAALLLAAARRHKTAQDLPFNVNGVRRSAAAAFSGSHFQGVLSLAETFSFNQAKHRPPFPPLLIQTLESL
jgi:DNA-binding IclR family transcriptional regulator